MLWAPYPPGGDPFTDGLPDKAPDVINNSWSCPSSEGCTNPDVLRLTVLFNPAVDMSTSEHFSAMRTRVTMEFGRDGRSRRLNGAETGVVQLKAA